MKIIIFDKPYYLQAQPILGVFILIILVKICLIQIISKLVKTTFNLPIGSYYDKHNA